MIDHDDHQWPMLPNGEASVPKGSRQLNSTIVLGLPCPTMSVREQQTVSIPHDEEEWMPAHLPSLTENRLWVNRSGWLDRHITRLRDMPQTELLVKVIAMLEAMFAPCSANVAELDFCIELAQALLQ